MELSTEKLSNNVIKVNLSGRMDLAGAGEIDIKFSGIAATPEASLVIDMSNVSFLASLGIRTLLLNAKAVARKGRKFVILNPSPDVENILKSAGIDSLIPICPNLEQAIETVSA